MVCDQNFYDVTYKNRFSAPGCKRIILDPGYLDCLHQPNVSLNWSPIESVVGEGIKLKNGDIVPLDVIIFATGYSLVKQISRMISGETDGNRNRNQRSLKSQEARAAPYMNTLTARMVPLHISGHVSLDSQTCSFFLVRLCILYISRISLDFVQGLMLPLDMRH
jgi:cation diffusion facilitator CzcD-associated flavoprotein CzcO